MTDPVTPELIKAQAAQLQEVALTDARATELAAEVDRINRVVREHAIDLEFDDEPARYAVLLRELRQESPE